MMEDRRHFIRCMSVASAAALAGLRPEGAAAEQPPETTRIRIAQVPSVCVAPQYVAAELLRSEGFADVQYVESLGGVPGAKAMAAGDSDIGMNFAAPLVVSVDEGHQVVMLAGVHVGCFELFGGARVRSINDLKGKTVAVFAMQSAQHVFLASMMTQVGLDPRSDVQWVVHPAAIAKQMLAEGKIDAYLGFPPDPQELRAKKIGRLVVNSATDRPWSQYFCCLISANREFVQRYPVAAKRAVRAILKASQICALEPDRATRAFLDRGFQMNPEYTLQAMKELPFGRWREYNPEDTLRFYALRLREAGMIKSNPGKVIAQGTDWRFLNELKKELKG
jgi:NitT/TauT family transport system substrate-binding protein